MLDVEDIRNQAFMDSDAVTTELAAGLARPESWSSHVEDGLDAFARVVHEVEAEKWARVIAGALEDPAFRKRLAFDPAETVREFGITVPPDLELRVVENSETVRHLVLPPSAPQGLPAAEVKALAEGLAFSTARTRLPQCWADTWRASVPLDPGMPQPRPIEQPPMEKPRK